MPEGPQPGPGDWRDQAADGGAAALTGDAADAAGLRRLRWHCRRGTKELDLLLLRYLDQVYPGATDDERATFVRLLDCQDPELAAWLYGRELPADLALAALVATIRALAAAPGRHP